MALWNLGYPDQALTRSQEALAWSQELAHPYTRGYTLDNVAICDLLRRETREGQERSEAGIALAREQDFPFWEGLGMVMRGWALALQNQSEETLSNIEDGMRIWRASGGEALRPIFLYTYALAWGGARPADGLRAVDEALMLIETTDERHSEVELYRTKGELLLTQKIKRHIANGKNQKSLTPSP